MPSPTHRTVPRKLPDGPIKLYPIKVMGETRVIDGCEVREVLIDQLAWSMLLDVVLRQQSAKERSKP